MFATVVPATTPPLTTFLQTPLCLPDRNALDELLQRDHPVVYVREEGALREAQLHASISPEEAFLDMATAYGSIAREGEGRGESPKRIVYMLELRLLETARIGTTSETEKGAQLFSVELAKQRKELPPH